ncbi:ankyrin repeat domain-containing protein [Shigella flexneri]
MITSNKLYNIIKSFKNDEILQEIKDIDLNEVSSYSPLPINTAIVFDNVDALKILIENGASVSSTDSDGLSPIENAAWVNNAKAIKILFEEQVNILQAESALKIAMAKGNTNASAALIKEGVEVNSNYLNRLLFISALRGENNNVRTFYLNGAKINYKKDGINVITGALRNKNEDTVKILIELAGEDVGVESPVINVNKEEWFSYIYGNEMDMVRLSIAKSTSKIVKIKNEDGLTALEIAAINEDIDLFKLLTKFYSKDEILKSDVLKSNQKMLSMIG